MWIVLSAVLVGFMVLLLGKYLQLQQRRRLLFQTGSVTSWTDVLGNPLLFRWIVSTDFGYGREVWGIREDKYEIDPRLRTFRNGVMILSAPRQSCLKEFCSAQQIKFADVVVK